MVFSVDKSIQKLRQIMWKLFFSIEYDSNNCKSRCCLSSVLSVIKSVHIIACFIKLLSQFKDLIINQTQ